MAGIYYQHWSPGNPFPSNAIHGGSDIDGTAIYVGRTYHNGDMVPTKVIPAKDAAYLSYGGEELYVSGCEVMCVGAVRWVPASCGEVPAGAIPVGNTKEGETLFAGRVYHEGSHTIGKVHPSHATCYIPFGGTEISNCNYEVLVYSNN